jgi:PqqD family protein of HPr-rel-A system
VIGQRPRARPDVLTRSSRRQRLLYDPRANTFHVLNETAELIWSLCDGRHTLEEIGEEVRRHFDVPQGVDLSADVERTIESLRRKGLLQEPEEAPETA